jgi:hypothetical protein
MIRKSTLAALVLSGFLFAGEPLFAQKSPDQDTQPIAERETSGSLDEEIALMRLDLRANRKKIIAANMKLTPDEAQWFWPTYNEYVDELVNINKAKYDLVKEYMANTNMTDEQADGLSKRWVEVDESVVQLRLKYIPIFRKVLSAKGTAMFFQLDRRVQMMIDLQLASSLPLIQP